jgi:hypothetical protein
MWWDLGLSVGVLVVGHVADGQDDLGSRLHILELLLLLLLVAECKVAPPLSPSSRLTQ